MSFSNKQHKTQDSYISVFRITSLYNFIVSRFSRRIASISAHLHRAIEDISRPGDLLHLRLYD